MVSEILPRICSLSRPLTSTMRMASSYCFGRYRVYESTASYMWLSASQTSKLCWWSMLVRSSWCLVIGDTRLSRMTIPSRGMTSLARVPRAVSAARSREAILDAALELFSRGRPATRCALLRERGAGLRSGRGAPHIDTSSLAPARQPSVRPCSSAPSSACLVARASRRGSCGRWSRPAPARHRAVARAGRRPARPCRARRRVRRRHPLVATEQRHAHHRFERDLAGEADRLERGDLSDRHVRVDELRVAGGDDDVGVGHEVEPTAGADAVDRGDHRLLHVLVPGGEVQIPLLHRVAVALDAHAVARRARGRSTPVWKARPSPV